MTDEVAANSTVAQIARDLAPELDLRLNDWLNDNRAPGSKERTRLERFLWDNKVALLRIVQAAAVKEKKTH